MHFPLPLPVHTEYDLTLDDHKSPLLNGRWLRAEQPEQGIEYRFETGALQKAEALTCDLLLQGPEATCFALRLQEGENGPCYLAHFAFIPQCQSRIRLPLRSVDQNRWLFEREGGWLKFIVEGDRVNLTKVDRASLRIFRKGDQPVEWCMTALTAVDRLPELLKDPLLPQGPLMDELGQSSLTNWPGKTPDVDQLIERLQTQKAEAGNAKWPEGFSKYGGNLELKMEASGFFRTHHDGKRWWLVDPEGYAFWSAGLDCVRATIDTHVGGMEKALSWSPENEPGFEEAWERTGETFKVDFFKANLIRAFGSAWKESWNSMVLADLKRFGFNTVANWSEWELAKDAGFPYVRPLSWPVQGTKLAPRIFRDCPDPFDPLFESEADSYARQLESTKDDPAFIGYFLMNEPTWGFASMSPAEGMLFQTESCEARRHLVLFLKERMDENELSERWGEAVTFEKIASGKWDRPVSMKAREDLEAFSTILGEKVFRRLSEACKKVDPHHLNLGARYHMVPPKWAMLAMGSFDVFSVNGYSETVNPDLAEACELLKMPAMIGEWHFGALDAGLPASGIGRVATQADRGRAFRVYTEDAAVQPWCVGVHYFTYADQSALGRNDGENYNIGFVDVCLNPYNELAEAARKSHDRLYDLAMGKTKPFNDRPEYLPRLFY